MPEQANMGWYKTNLCFTSEKLQTFLIQISAEWTQCAWILCSVIFHINSNVRLVFQTMLLCVRAITFLFVGLFDVKFSRCPPIANDTINHMSHLNMRRHKLNDCTRFTWSSLHPARVKETDQFAFSFCRFPYRRLQLKYPHWLVLFFVSERHASVI